MSTDFASGNTIQELHLYDGLEEDFYAGEQLIPGPAGDIEALIEYPLDYRKGRPVAVICHPHPLYGGSMANKVVHILSDTFLEMGLPTLRFNFRGVGKSRGRFDKGDGESQDLLAVIEWFRARNQQPPVWLAGFSFGAYVATRAHARAPGVERLLLVAPPVSMFDFSLTGQVELPSIVIQGGKDEVIDPLAVSHWVHSQPRKPRYYWLSDADHFFHGRLNRIRDLVKTGWQEAAVPG